jgi:hypothetical protein
MGQVILSDRMHLPVDLDVPLDRRTLSVSLIRLSLFTIPEAELS